MSTYAVFGMTISRAIADARKSTLEVERRNGVTVELSEPEWLAKCDRVANETMAGTRTARLSDMFDAPQYAEEFAELARKELSRGICVRAHCFTGEVDPKTRKPVRKWVDYNSEAYRDIQRRVAALSPVFA